ncbi:insulin receptor substrate 2-B-like isoform X2 [Myxocyprinus asiaticus]|uniref:insulin receptor substrate 2-B-like isoform X2 n=1 Tax=Myxocyprinus asiaticus TaxID=70543 RepID=UPI0022236312|nr:insulin receptor substrate 2-B-like isoform X2 [Myxocyprinus asiaticus]
MEDRPHLPNHGVMLTLEAQPRRAVTKSGATNGDISCAAREPLSSASSSSSTTSINNSGSRLPMHLTASSHSQPQRRYHPPYHFKVHHLFPDESPQDAVLRKNLPPLQYKVHDSAFCRVLSADTTAAALAAAAVCSGGVDRDIWKCGYLRKQKHGHKRFFVLRGPGNLGPSRLEYYDSEKKFRSALKAAASGIACPAKRVIYLSQCFTVNKRADAKNKYLIALYTKDEYFSVVAENEQEQEDWYLALTELMTEGKKGLLDTDELDDGYGTISPGTIFKEVWQVNVKPKGLGQTKNLMGVYHLCLSAKTIHLVKLNSETPAVNLPLMNIRRCGHSESFFFIEVGRSSSIGPGKIWVQVEDSVVAQNMHETILDTMKALKAFPDFRPRSKSQSSGSNPIPFITTCQHLGKLPPSQTGLQRPSRTDSVMGTPPTGKSKGGRGQRYRTSSEGEGTQDRALSSGTGSLVHLNTPILSVGREETGSCCAHASPGSTQHTRSASLPVSHFLSATSPISVSSSSGHGSASDTHTRPSSSSICGSPSDGGFNSSDEFCPSPCEFRYFHASCTTPESHGNTPPIRDDYRLTEYMAMDWHKDGARTFEEESSYMERTFLKLAHSSKPKPGGGLGVMQQKATQTSLDESNPVESKRRQVCSCLLKSAYKSYSELHHPNKPPLLSSECQKKLPKDDNYIPKMYSNADYIPMQPRANHLSTMEIHPCSSQQADRYGYMMMLPGDCPSSREQAEYDDYMDMSQITMAEGFSQASPESQKSHASYFSLPRSYKAPSREKRGKTEYIPMSPAETPSPPSPGEYIQMDFGDRPTHATVSPPSINSPSTPPPSQPCYQLCCSSPDHDYLGLNMDSLLKDRPPRHSLVAPWNPPNYARPLGCSYGQASTNLDPEKMHGGCGDANSPLRMMQHLCISEWLPLGQTQPKVIRVDPQGRRRHSSETFIPSSGSSVNGCIIRPSAYQNLPEASRWQNSTSFDNVWSRTEASPDSVNSATGGMHQNTSSSYLSYIALDMREVPRDTRNTPTPHPAHSNLQGSEAYAGIDFSVSGGDSTASKD